MLTTILASLLLAVQTAGNPVLDKFLDKCDSLYNVGLQFAEHGLPRMADWFVGQSVAGVASLNNAVMTLYREEREQAEHSALMSDLDEFDMADSFAGLFEFAEALQAGADKFGEAVNDIPGINIVDDEVYWSTGRRCISLVSPYEDLFMGLISDFRGDADNAKYYYTLAYVNPFLDRDLCDFSFLARMDTDDLYDLSALLDSKEREYRAILSDNGFYLDLVALIHWDAPYFHGMARKVLEKENPDVFAAIKYCEAALRVDPFEPVNYEICGRLAALVGDYPKLEKLTNECLVFDPDNAFFNEVVRIYKKYMEQ
jgi:tetratricopeptide (TPR) repeat protein